MKLHRKHTFIRRSFCGPFAYQRALGNQPLPYITYFSSQNLLEFEVSGRDYYIPRTYAYAKKAARATQNGIRIMVMRMYADTPRPWLIRSSVFASRVYRGAFKRNVTELGQIRIGKGVYTHRAAKANLVGRKIILCYMSDYPNRILDARYANIKSFKPYANS